jgi:hypothetical protein
MAFQDGNQDAAYSIEEIKGYNAPSYRCRFGRK